MRSPEEDVVVVAGTRAAAGFGTLTGVEEFVGVFGAEGGGRGGDLEMTTVGRESFESLLFSSCSQRLAGDQILKRRGFVQRFRGASSSKINKNKKNVALILDYIFSVIKLFLSLVFWTVKDSFEKLQLTLRNYYHFSYFIKLY